jgi:hypothetical protein
VQLRLALGCSDAEDAIETAKRLVRERAQLKAALAGYENPGKTRWCEECARLATELAKVERERDALAGGGKG